MQTTDYWNKSLTSAVKACLLFAAAILALLPSSTKAQCAMGWYVGGQWGLQQGPTRVAMDLRQNGTVVTGTAKYHFSTKPRKNVLGIVTKYGGVGDVSGSVSGTVTGDNFNVQIVWDNQSTGIYSGKIGPKGRMEGNVFDRAKPSWKGTWYTETNLICKPPRF